MTEIDASMTFEPRSGNGSFLSPNAASGGAKDEENDDDYPVQ